MTDSVDVLIFNADLPTVSPSQKAQSRHVADAVAVKDDKIVAVGSTADLDVLANSATRRLDADGGALIPGINDSHLHFSVLANIKYGYIDISAKQCSSWQAVEARLCEAALQRPHVIKAHGWDDFRLGPGGPEMLADLGLDIPIVLFDQTGHQLLANELLVHSAGITSSTADPVGGVIGRLDDGQPNGLFIDSAMEFVIRAIPETPEQQTHQTRIQCQAMLHSLGITSITDPGLGPGGLGLLDGGATEGAFETLIRLAQSDELTLRTNVLLLFSGTGGASAQAIEHGLASDLPARLSHLEIDPKLLRIAGVKVFADGTPRSGTAWMSAPYGSDCVCGSMVTSGSTDEARLTELNEIVRLIDRAGLQAGIHATGDATTTAAINAIIAAQEANVATSHRDLRHYVIHGAFNGAAAPGELKRMANNGIGYCTNPLIRFEAGAALEELLGRERFAWHQPLASAHAEEVRFTATSDAPVTTPDWRGEIIAMATRTTRNHSSPINPSEKIDSRAALASMTTHAAWQDHAEHYKGSIAPGQVADLCLLEERWPDEEGISELMTNEIRNTWHAGQLVHGQYI